MEALTKENSAIPLDGTDRLLLRELQDDADRPNVELARLAGLSPAATLNRVRRLKETGLLASIRARVDPDRAGFPLQVYVAVTLAEHDERSHARFEKALGLIPGVLEADWVTGETDALLRVVARDVRDLGQVQLMLQEAGAQRVLTLLRLGGIKSEAPLPV
jgi:Lrp/AsnC family leucine-responsive transcriptional regulator